jgi:RNA polymerase sigma-70 factor (ECF subfamily)
MAKGIDEELPVERFNRGARPKRWVGTSRLSDGAEGLDRIKPPLGRAAFDRIVDEYSAEIAVLANRLLGWPGEVEDVVQDVLLAAFLGLKKFRCDCSLKTWLFTITVNKCRTYRYKRMLRLKMFSQAITESSFAQWRAQENTSIDREIFEGVRRAIKALPAKCREAVVLKYLQELPTDQICRILGISDNALQVRLHRARQLLRRNLAGLIEKNL